jgi:transcription-repair coupling factor (superfamily II helicase)
MNVLLDKFSQDPDFKTILTALDMKISEQLVAGLSGSSRQLMLAALYRESKRPAIVLTHNMFQAQKVVEDLVEILPSSEVLLYPANEMIATESATASPETMAQRIQVLTRVSQGFQGVLVTPYAGLKKLIPPRAVMKDAYLSLEEGQSMPLEDLLEKLVYLGYERVDRVENPGEMSSRGGILDIFPVTAESPYRIEFFDIEVDSIRSFDVQSQRSIDKLKQIRIPLSKEIIASPDRFKNAAQKVHDMLEDQLKKIKDHSVKEKLLEKIQWEIEQLRESSRFTELYKYISVLYPKAETLLDYMPKETMIILDEPARVLESVKQQDRDEAEWKTALLSQGEFLPALQLSQSYDELIKPSRNPIIYLSLFVKQIPHTQPQNIVNFVCRTMQNFHGQMNVLKAEVERWLRSNQAVWFMAGSSERAERLERILDDYGVDTRSITRWEEGTSSIPSIVTGNLNQGFEMPSLRMVILTENEVFTQKQRKAKKTSKLSNAERIKNYLELKTGDYVVHVNHGIGKYIGIETLVVGGLHKDYLHIKYAGNDKLYVPIEQIDLVQKYVGSEEKEPKVYQLGGSDWTRVKNKVRSSVQDIAQDLIKLYAERQASHGYSFQTDTPYQREFEALFPYEETQDQLRTIDEIKKDMEMSRPMDRLLCGDVGYGKTEVAVRAAFKAAIEGKQVAILVPTTILAQQHYETFRERFADYPISVQVLSRFRSKKEQNEAIKGLKNGTVDIIIGTHRLLSQDVQFKDLGLVIVDEEQRFGVTHKEKLKRLKNNVDVLTLTATPIPRTLHMSMLGVRDLSVIETPPENRFPVQTYVIEYSAGLVRDAIERELARNGQVYFLFNKVQGINQMAEQISALVPEAKVGVGHGQMSEQELEKVILDFLDGELDVLVSTTIIETGVDIPNVNTLLVYDADKMGLSQLYQLRGRVGRSNRIAYAYFTYQRDKVLNEVAEKRLQAIKEFTELGSGFKIAMRDLAIRGAGNLLGAEQHGFIASVGFDLYSQMLSEEIEVLKGQAPKPKEVSPTIDIKLDAYLPSDYIYDSMQKIELYKKFAAVKTLEEATDLEEEIEDRFGDLPSQVRHLLTVSRLKAYAHEYQFEEIVQKNDEIVVKIASTQNDQINGQQLFKLANQFENKIRLGSGKQITIKVSTKGSKIEKAVELLERFLIQYKEVLKKKGELQDVAQ